VTIDCRQLPDLLFDYISGEMTPERRDLLEAHLKACPPCLVHVQTYRVTIAVGRALPCRDLPPDCEKRLREKLAKECPGGIGGDIV
jgi:anti-sigma factor RsiW